MHPQQFADGTTEGGDGTRRDLDRLEKWAHENLLRLSKAQCGCCTWVGAMPGVCRLGEELTESSPAEWGGGLKSWT